MSPQARAQAEKRAKELSDEIDLARLRKARKLTQKQLAVKMGIKQPEIAKIERRTDMLLSTLASALRAMGAELKIIASFPGHDIRIESLGGVTNGRNRARTALPKGADRRAPARRRTPRRANLAG